MVRNLSMTMSQYLYLINTASGEKLIGALHGSQWAVTLDVCGAVAFSPTQLWYKIN